MKKKKTTPKTLVDMILGLPADMFVPLLKLNKKLFEIAADIEDYFITHLNDFKENKRKRSTLYRILISIIFLLMTAAILLPLLLNSKVAIRTVSFPLVYIALCAWLLSSVIKRDDDNRSTLYRALIYFIGLLMLAAFLIPIITNSLITISALSFPLTIAATFVWLISGYIKRND
jgi:dolichol kinase